MSTNSMIFKMSDDGKSVRGIYCHWDGYINGVGYVLQNYYQDPEKVEKLIGLGDISSLGKHVETSEAVQRFGFYPNTNKEFCKLDDDTQARLSEEATYHTVAYHRDRGESKNIMEMTYDEFQVCLENNSFHYSGPEFVYLMVQTWSGYKWLVSSFSRFFKVCGELQVLTSALKDAE